MVAIRTTFSVSAFAVCCVAASALAAEPAGAPAQASRSAAPAIDVKASEARLRSGDDAQVRGALDDARMAGPGAAALAPTIATVLAKGLSLSLTEAAIETLADLEAEPASAALAQYATHREPKVRRAAVKALARTKGAAAVATCRRALSDPDPVVRATAAGALGSLKARDATADLLLALDRRVFEAAVSVGQLCSPEQCERLAAKLGKLPFDVVTGGLEQVLARPASEISDDAKIKIVGRVRELGTIEANKFLREVQKRSSGASPRVRQAIDGAVLATSGGVQ